MPQSGSSAVYQTVGGLIGSGKYSSLTIFDLKLLDQNGNPFEPTGGTVTVRISIPSGMSGNPHVYWYNPANGTLMDMNATQGDGYLVFTTTHFNNYAVAQLVSSTGGNSTGGASFSGNTDSVTSSGTTANPKTGSSSNPVMPIALLGACSAVGLVVTRKHAKCLVKR